MQQNRLPTGRRRVIYVCGPIRSKWPFVRYINIWKARNVAVRLMKAGFTVICPHLNSLFMGRVIDEDEIVRRDLELVRRSDFLAVIGKYWKSKGCCAELREAWCHGIERVAKIDWIVENVAPIKD